MRKDPPFDMEYVYTTYILDRAEKDGALIVNAPQALRDMNEKAYTAWFPEITPTTLITRSMAEMKSFLAEHGRVVAKPLDGMGGRSIFVVKKGDKNANVIFETLTDYGTSGRDFEICEQVGPYLRDAGVLFAGIDVIGDFLTEVNVTSPTGIRELDKQFGLNIAGLLFDAIYASQKLK
jgi:glutathione synthase